MMKSVIIGAAASGLVVAMDEFVLRWSGDDPAIRTGIALAAFLVSWSVARIWLEPAPPPAPGSMFGNRRD